MITDTYSAPMNPPDFEAAALDHLLRAPKAATGTTRFRAPLQDLATAVDAEQILIGLGWDDSRQVAATTSFDAITEDEPSFVLRDRAQLVLAGRDGHPWRDSTGVARALNIAATVLDEL